MYFGAQTRSNDKRKGNRSFCLRESFFLPISYKNIKYIYKLGRAGRQQRRFNLDHCNNAMDRSHLIKWVVESCFCKLQVGTWCESYVYLSLNHDSSNWTKMHLWAPGRAHSFSTPHREKCNLRLILLMNNKTVLFQCNSRTPARLHLLKQKSPKIYWTIETVIFTK